jgi:hypothetical protein
MTYITYTYDPPILEHDQYRYTCDHCEWVSDNYQHLYQAATALTEHTRSDHAPKPKRSDTPPPLNARQVLELIRNK